MKKIGFKMAAALAVLLVVSGCATKAPPYDVSVDNVNVLKRGGTAPVRVGSFSVKAGAKGAESISLRGNGMSSPVGADYAAYIADALKQELTLAKRLDANANLEISGALINTDIDTAMGTASGYAEARFVVTKDGQVRYDKTKRGDASWDSSFMGNIAIPAAQRNYPVIVQHLLSSLYSDTDFQNALK